MPAQAADIGPGTRHATIAEWQDSTVRSRYPNARDGSEQPAEGYFDDLGDAQDAIDARGALAGVERRRFAVSAPGLDWPSPEAGLPTIRLVDAQLSIDRDFLPSRIELDLEEEVTSWGLYG